MKNLLIIIFSLFALGVIVSCTPVGDAIVMEENGLENNITEQVLELLQSCSTQEVGERHQNNYFDLDLNSDSVVTGDELCTYHNLTCVFTQGMRYNIPLDDGTFLHSPQGVIKGCFGGESSSNYQENIDISMMARCCQS